MVEVDFTKFILKFGGSLFDKFMQIFSIFTDIYCYLTEYSNNFHIDM